MMLFKVFFGAVIILAATLVKSAVVASPGFDDDLVPVNITLPRGLNISGESMNLDSSRVHTTSLAPLTSD
jgi:hypothetical protein